MLFLNPVSGNQFVYVTLKKTGSDFSYKNT